MNARFALMLGALVLLAACGQGPAGDPPLDGDWALVPGESRVGFVSVKGGQIAEAHHFTGLSGSVSADGAAQLVIDLASVETQIPIRNERMGTLLFDLARFPQARIALSVDPSSLAGLASGETMAIAADAAISLNGAEQTLPADLGVTRIGPDKVRVETRTPIILAAGSFGLAAGVERLREVAGLPAITEQVPVSASLTYLRQ